MYQTQEIETYSICTRRTTNKSLYYVDYDKILACARYNDGMLLYVLTNIICPLS